MKRKCKWLWWVLSLVLLLAMGFIIESCLEKHDRENLNPSDKTITAGPYSGVLLSGDDSAVPLVFLAGSGTPYAYTDFSGLYDALNTDRSCLFVDRPGMGFGEEADSPRDMETILRELEKLISLAFPDRQILLIAHSLASLEALEYAYSYPEKVAGVVFLDGGSPGYYADSSEFFAKCLNIANGFWTKSGLARLSASLGLYLPSYGLSVRQKYITDDLAPMDLMLYYQKSGSRSVRDYLSYMNENARSLQNKGSLGDLPILVLSSGGDLKWKEAQNELCALSTNCTYLCLENASHYLHWSNTLDVAAAISEFIH